LSRSKTRSLHRIVAAYTVNQLGWWFALVALSLGVYDHTHSTLAVAAVFDIAIIPALFAPAVVARVEASPRRGALSLLYVIEAACAVGLAALLWQFSLPAILLLVMLDGSVAYAARGILRSEAAQAGLAAAGGPPEGVPSGGEDDGAGAHRANAYLNISLALSGVGGPALASFATHGFGAPAALLIDAGCFITSAALVRYLRPHVEEASSSVRERIVAARAYLRTVPRLRLLIVAEFIATIFFFLPLPVEVAYATSTLHAGDLGYGALLATWGVGLVVGSLLFARAGRWLWAMLAGGTLAGGLAYVGFSLAPSLAVACIAALPGGMGNGVQWAAFLGIVQELTPARLLARIMGLVEGGAAVASVIGYSVGGALALASPRAALFAAGVAASLMTLPFLRLGGIGPFGKGAPTSLATAEQEQPVPAASVERVGPPA
jgi:MFS family permease